MKKQIKCLALMLLALILVIASIMANEMMGYPADVILWIIGILAGVCGFVGIFLDKDE